MGRRVSAAVRRRAEDHDWELQQQRQQQQTEEQQAILQEESEQTSANQDEAQAIPSTEVLHVITVGKADVGTRADTLLASRLPGGLTRSRVQRAIRDGGVLLNGSPFSKLSVKIRCGDQLAWIRDAIREAPGFVQPEDIPLQVYHEDESCIVLEKPAGMTVHPAKGLRTGTLVNALLHHTGCGPVPECGALGNDSDGDSADDNDASSLQSEKLSQLSHGGSAHVRPGIVHRLDRGTSGVMVVAKTDAAHAALAGQFAAHSSRRTYLALVWGSPDPAEGVVRGSIGRDPTDRLRMTVVPDGKGKPAITHYSVVAALDGGHVSLVRFRLETGRTHQVRVHARHIGHPLLGDVTYKGAQLLRGPRTPERVHMYEHLFKDGGVLSRPALHAETLGFAHPTTQSWLSFHSDLPADISASIDMIKACHSAAAG